MSNNEHAAFVAALLMARGQISASSGKDKPNRAVLRITCAERDLAEQLAAHFGGSVTETHATYSPERTLYLWVARGPTAVAVLERALPYLIGFTRSKAMYILERALAKESA